MFWRRRIKKLTHRCKLYLSDIEDGNSHALLQCYTNRILYECRYPDDIEKKLDEIDKICKRGLHPPWWVDQFE